MAKGNKASEAGKKKKTVAAPVEETPAEEQPAKADQKKKLKAKKRALNEDVAAEPEEQKAEKPAKKARKAVDSKPVSAVAADAVPEVAAPEAVSDVANTSQPQKRLQDLLPVKLFDVPNGATEADISAGFAAAFGVRPPRILQNDRTWTVFLSTEEEQQQALARSPITIRGQEVSVKLGITRRAPNNIYIYSIPAQMNEPDVIQAFNSVLGDGSLCELRFLRRDLGGVVGGVAVARMKSEEVATKATDMGIIKAGQKRMYCYPYAPEGHPRSVNTRRLPDGLSVTDAVQQLEKTTGSHSVVDAQITRNNIGFFILATDEAYHAALAATDISFGGQPNQLFPVVSPPEHRRLFYTNTAGAMEILQHFKSLGERAIVALDLTFQKDTPNTGRGSVAFASPVLANQAIKLGPIVDGDRHVEFSWDHSKAQRFYAPGQGKVFGRGRGRGRGRQ